ncbi:L-seryl-tRNA(Sec) selenium transferase [Streptomyces sp. JJ36]|uniref:L-seryl-tRNA(Sec) selenium transferase n=1 Tax=Streptomyces sp. JJ36 TaxID=2736645 RepID=UPI001F01F6D6|nr:L-seryl-tRNA(Sec) selenium transferase [Streptomyces sp. JJ36]MCF6521940.1 L-seryl-tRNA(Sec) selenium transferase [Streptomyces sp. JJ36]
METRRTHTGPAAEAPPGGAAVPRDGTGTPEGGAAPGTAPDARRRIARTDALLADPRLTAAASSLGRDLVKSAVTAAQQRARAGEIPPDAVADAAVAALPDTAGGLRPVLNATGVLLHTNLGRAALSGAAREALQAAAGTTDVELDPATGRRGRRGRTARAALLERVPAAEDAHLVNNGAAALALAAAALAPGREVVVSRGEMVEIGDGFRLPELLESAGARLREVGTTNRTSFADYAGAVGPETGFVLKVHPSNFRVTGFTRSVPVSGLARLDVPVVADIGSGLLEPEPLLPDEPDAGTWLRQGAGLVTASGDKLLGGPQCGLLLGRSALVQRLARHPLARAFRVDKLTLAALEATVRGPRTPTWHALHAGADRLADRALELAGRLRADGIDAREVASDATVGGGGAPGVVLPSAAVSLPDGFAERLRQGRPAVLGRVADGRCLLDLRAVPEEADDALATAVRAAAAGEAGESGGAPGAGAGSSGAGPGAASSAVPGADADGGPGREHP